MVARTTREILRRAKFPDLSGRRLRRSLHAGSEMKAFPVCIGYDPREAITFHVLAHSIMARASGPVQIIPVNLANLKDIYTRPRDSGQSTDFTYARFLTP